MSRSPGHTRRSFLQTSGVAGLAAVSGRIDLNSPQRERSRDSVTDSGGGEHLIHFRDGGDVFIKFGAASGSASLAMGTQQVTRGTGIPVHRHLEANEAFYVLSGSGTILLNDTPKPLGAGATVFIPRNTWHGFANPDHELLLLSCCGPSLQPDLKASFARHAVRSARRENSSRVNKYMPSRKSTRLSSGKRKRSCSGFEKSIAFQDRVGCWRNFSSMNTL
jgi:quercetin dioxygenase-like cupin family protein